MTPEQQIAATFYSLLNDKASFAWCKLSDQGRQLVITSLLDFINRAVIKYQQGEAEHGGQLVDRDCMKELGNELIDFMFYYYGELERRNKQIVRDNKLFSKIYD